MKTAGTRPAAPIIVPTTAPFAVASPSLGPKDVEPSAAISVSPAFSLPVEEEEIIGEPDHPLEGKLLALHERQPSSLIEEYQHLTGLLRPLTEEDILEGDELTEEIKTNAETRVS